MAKKWGVLATCASVTLLLGCGRLFMSPRPEEAFEARQAHMAEAEEPLRRAIELDPDYVQFGCAEWFWHKSCNSYVLQVEPMRHKILDQVTVDHSEALHIEEIRDQFFIKMREILERYSNDSG